MAIETEFGHEPDRIVRSAALFAVLALALLSNAAPAEAPRPALTGDALVLQYLGPSAHRKEVPKGDAYVDRETARGYMDGVKDLTQGTRWCDPGGAPHELHADIVGAISKLSPKRRRSNAAALVAEVLGHMFPCGSAGGKP